MVGRLLIPRTAGPAKMVTSAAAGGLTVWGMVLGGLTFPPGSFLRSFSLLPLTLMVSEVSLTQPPSGSVRP